MPRLKEFAFILVCLGLFAAAQNEEQARSRSKAAPQKAGEQAPVPRNAHGEPQLDGVQQANALIGKSIQMPGARAQAKVEDVLLDLNTGRVAVVVFKAEGQSQFALPPTALSVDAKTKSLTSKVTSEQLKTAAWDAGQSDKQQLDKLYQLFGQEAYPQKQEPAGKRVDRKLVSVAKLQGVPVHNTKGEPLGAVSDVGIALNEGLIAYVAVSCSCFDDAGGKLFPVPLSAFVIKPDSKAWILELPLDVLANTPTFAEKHWPEKIDRGWVEYVHVRYGRSPFGGAQHQLREERQ